MALVRSCRSLMPGALGVGVGAPVTPVKAPRTRARQLPHVAVYETLKLGLRSAEKTHLIFNRVTYETTSLRREMTPLTTMPRRALS